MSNTHEASRRSVFRKVLIAIVALACVFVALAFLLKPSTPSEAQIAAAVQRDAALIEKA